MSRFTLVKETYTISILVLIICAVACLPSENMSSPEPPGHVAVPSTPSDNVQETPALASPQPNPNIVFQDDFTNPGGGWSVFSNDFGEGKYENGGFYLKCTRPSYPEFKVYTINPALTSMKGFMIDMDVTMLSGGRDDRVGVIIKWPDINPMDIPGYVQPSDYYFLLFPADGSVACYSKHVIKGSSADLEPGYFVRRAPFACVKGVNEVNNIKIWFNPRLFFSVNGYKLVDFADDNINYVNRLIADGSMPGATLEITANSEDPYSRPVFQINRISVAVPR
ncbi:MAG: hypothetical protein WC566_06410 [Dehalococcoidia bacterium]